MVFCHSNHDSHMTPCPLTGHLNVCTKYKTARLEARHEHGNNDLFHNFFDTERLPTSSLMTSDRLCDQVLHIIAGNLSFSQAENPEIVASLENIYLTYNIPNHHSIAAWLKAVTKE